MINKNNYATYKLSLKLKEFGYPQIPDDGDQMWTKENENPLTFNSNNKINEDYILAPLLIDVREWLQNEYKIIIVVDIPYFTYALASRVAYFFSVWEIDEENENIVCIHDVETALKNHQCCGGSYNVQLEEGIITAINYIKNKNGKKIII